MVRRPKRRDELFEAEKRDMLEVLGRCRRAILASHAKLRPGRPTYVLGSGVVTAIDKLAELLTGNPDYFHVEMHSTGQHVRRTEE
jgi:hypothetical protein